MKLLSLLSFLLIITLSSCNYFGGEKIYGDGNTVSQARNVSAFSAIEAAGAVEIQFEQGPAGVKVSADQNLQQYVEVFTEGDILIVQYSKNVNLKPSSDIIIYVSAPALNSVDVSGASEFIAKGSITGTGELLVSASGASGVEMNVNVPKLEVDISGASHVDLSGKANDVVALASGASKIRAMELVSETADIDVSGASDAEITANTKMKVSASGASSVKYKGNAAVAQQVSGAGSVKRVN